MLIIRSFFLSFAALWRFLIFLPIIAIFTISLILGTYLLVILSLFSKAYLILLIIIVSVIYVTGSTFAGLVTIRCALAGKGVYGIPVFSRLLGASFKFGILQLVFYIAVYFAAAMIVAILELYEFQDIRGLIADGEIEKLGDFLEKSPELLYLALSLFVVANAFFAALLVPMAANSYSASAKTDPHDLFWGFGAGFIEIFIVVVIVALIGYYTEIYVHSVEFVTYIATYINSLFASKLSAPDMDPNHLVTIAASFFGAMWLYCWQYAAGALAFLRRRKRMEEAKAKIEAQPVVHSVDLAELRKSRQ